MKRNQSVGVGESVVSVTAELVRVMVLLLLLMS